MPWKGFSGALGFLGYRNVRNTGINTNDSAGYLFKKNTHKKNHNNIKSRFQLLLKLSVTSIVLFSFFLRGLVNGCNMIGWLQRSLDHVASHLSKINNERPDTFFSSHLAEQRGEGTEREMPQGNCTNSGILTHLPINVHSPSSQNNLIIFYMFVFLFVIFKLF